MSAVLVMESRGVIPGTRSFQFSDAWSQLYRVDDYYVDLMYQPDQSAGTLHGQVLRADGESEDFQGQANLSQSEDAIDTQGQFDLNVEAQGSLNLTLNLSDKVIEINGLSFIQTV